MHSARKPVDHRAQETCRTSLAVTGLGHVRKTRTIKCTVTGGGFEQSTNSGPILVSFYTLTFSLSRIWTGPPIRSSVAMVPVASFKAIQLNQRDDCDAEHQPSHHRDKARLNESHDR